MFELLRNLLDGLAVSFDLPILDWIAANLWCPFLDVVMPIITVFGDHGIFWIAIAVLLFLTKKHRKTGLGMAFALAMGLLVCNIILKPLVGRIRPYDFQIQEMGRTWNDLLAGGALLDIGIYGLNFALMHFGGGFDRVESSVRMTETGVDGMETITLFYPDGRMAVLTHSIYSRSDRKGIIHGNKGYVVVENINNPQSISVYDTNDCLLAHYAVPEQISGYEYEFREAVRCIREGKLQSDSMPMADTVAMMELMDSLRQQWGLVYPQERE